MTIVSVYTPTPVPVPRFAPVAAAMFARLLQWAGDAAQAVAEARRAAERQRQARELRRFALLYARHDPRFTADLLAAADRHERDA